MVRTLFSIALRHLFGRKRQSLTTIAGVAVSTMVLITTISLTRGLLDSFVATIVDVAPHITIEGKPIESLPVDLLSDAEAQRHAFVDENIQKEDRDEVRNYRQVLEVLDSKQYAGEVVAVSPFIESRVIVIKGNKSQPISMKGVVIERENAISGIEDKLTAGDLAFFETTPNALLVGRTVAMDMGLELHDEMSVVPVSGPVRQCKVAGIFFSGVNAIDNTVFVSLKFGQILENLPADKVSGIGIKVVDPLANEPLAGVLERVTGYNCITWQEDNASVLSLFNRIGFIVFSLVAFVGVVSGFGVANILVTTVFEKSRDIAIMKSYGFSAGSLVGMFILEGFLVGFAGTLAGGVLATGSINLLANIPVETSQGPLTKTGFSMSWNPLYFLFVMLLTVFISTIAATIPSTRAAKLEPVEVLRDSSL
ncbi:ABC transporter permease [Prosthecochloris sp. SCSIO W1101]|uniref:ABC transporter permease n=1 Tax=Prosthecochloris sp. SCSIO W1101 TaxID=2992242 RepID=UPI00223D3E29|nr:FtsX-like permease family protein [Prosthecochloris sp. SCSIO W1101]UZJ41064.1 ABC transporter permease [Prosthecochloris sp. SCSIO W1101]